MKGPSKVLLLKNHREHALARSWIVDEGGLHGRSIPDSTELNETLRRDRFELVLVDQRQSDDDLIETLSGVRQFQPESRLLVLSDKLALPQVIQAMRYGVRDIFQPPIDLTEFILRVHADLGGEAIRAGAQETPTVISRWSDLMHALDGSPARAVAAREQAPTPPPPPPPPPDLEPPPELLLELKNLRTALDEQRRETEHLRRKLSVSEAAHASLTTEVDRLINQEVTSRTGEAASSRELEDEVTRLREENLASQAAGLEAGRRIAAMERQLEEAQKRMRDLEAAAAAAITAPPPPPAGENGTGAAAEILAVQRELEFHINNSARLQEQLAHSVLAHAEVTKELARLGGIEARAHRYESQFSASKLELAQEKEGRRKLEQQLEAAQARSAALEAGTKKLTAELESRERTVAEKTAAAAQATAAADAAAQAAAAAREQQGRAEAAAMAERDRCARAEVEVARREAAALTALEEARKRDAETAAMLEAEQVVLESQRKKLLRETEETRTLQESVRAQQELLARREQELKLAGEKAAQVAAAQKAEAEQLEAARQKLESDAARLENERTQLASTRKKLESDAARLQADLAQLAERTKKLDEQRASIRGELKRLYDAI